MHQSGAIDIGNFGHADVLSTFGGSKKRVGVIYKMTPKIGALEKGGGGSLLYQKLHVERQILPKNPEINNFTQCSLQDTLGKETGKHLRSEVLHSRPSPS